MRRGVVHLLVPIIIIIVAIVGLGAYLIVKSRSDNNVSQNATTESVSPTESLPQTDDADIQNTPQPTQTDSTIQPTSEPTLPVVSKAVCNIVSSPDADNSYAVKLAYGLTNNSTNAYMTGAQWDFNGDGSWDTDMSLQNGSLTHTFSSGNHTVKLQLKLSNGETTGVCSTVVTAPQGISVSFNGKVFADKNCNNAWDTDEQFVSGITVNIFRQPGNNVFKTLTTDSGGNFSFSTNIAGSENLTITPSALGTLTPPYYKIFYNAPNYTLNNTTRSASTTLSIIPAENVGSCPI